MNAQDKLDFLKSVDTIAPAKLAVDWVYPSGKSVPPFFRAEVLKALPDLIQATLRKQLKALEAEAKTEIRAEILKTEAALQALKDKLASLKDAP